MMISKQKVFNAFLSLASRIIRRKLMAFRPSILGNSSKTAVRSDYGFWYVGNIFDQADIAYGILQNGQVEKEETELVIRALKKLMEKKERLVFFDIGANTGYYGILAGSLGKGKISVCAFEPQEENIKCLNESVLLNRLDNIFRIFALALSSENREGMIYGTGTGASLNKDFLSNNKVEGRSVKLKKLDDLFTEENLFSPDFIKIDVEGHELQVLQGAKDVIKRSLPVLFVEIAYSLKNIGRDYLNRDYNDTFRFLETFGYESFHLKNNFLEKVPKEYKNNGVEMFLFLHPQNHDFLKVL